MKKKTKRKIIRISILVLLGIVFGVGLMIYNVLGPLRTFFWNVPYLAGFLGPRTYLVLLQNNNELRPTGGFVTAVAEVSTLFGFPSIEVFDSYQISNPQPKIPAPEPFQYFIGQSDPFFAGWTLRDANFSPDFKKSAEDTIALYKQAYPDKDIDGVYAIDFAVMERLLGLYGPLEIDDTKFTPENFFIQTQRISKDIDTHNEEALRNRKNILKPFAQTLTNTIVKSPGKYGELFDTINTLIEKKHILAYSSADNFQNKLESFGMAQRILNNDLEADFLHLNIANIGGRKADRYVTKDIKYRADFSNPSRHQSVLEVTLEHLGSYNIQSDIYQAYIRAYVPQNSELSSSSTGGLRGTQVGSDLNLQVFADYIRLRPGEKITLNYTYLLPETIIPENYQLQLIKQPGIQNQFWQVAVRQQNDSSMQNISLKPHTQEMTIRENLALWRGELETDLHFHIIKHADVSAPIILWQEFVDLNTINIRFQERVDATSAENIENYMLTDMNKENPISDDIQVIAADFDERDLWLSVAGVSAQPEEHYQLIIKDVQDVHGNMIQPNPLSRTLVQRIDNQ